MFKQPPVDLLGHIGGDQTVAAAGKGVFAPEGVIDSVDVVGSDGEELSDGGKSLTKVLLDLCAQDRVECVSNLVPELVPYIRFDVDGTVSVDDVRQHPVGCSDDSLVVVSARHSEGERETGRDG